MHWVLKPSATDRGALGLLMLVVADFSAVAGCSGFPAALISEVVLCAGTGSRGSDHRADWPSNKSLRANLLCQSKLGLIVLSCWDLNAG